MYEVRKTTTLFGKQYRPGEVIPDEVLAQHKSPSTLLRAGVLVFRGPKNEDPNSVRSDRARRAPKAEPEPVMTEVVAPKVTVRPAKKTAAKKAPAKKVAP